MIVRFLQGLALALALVPAAAQAQTSDALFEPGTLHDIRLTINSRDLEELRATYLENTYYPADFEWGGVRVRSVGIRSRGNASRNPDKLGLRVDFDRYVGKQRFLGLKSLVLDNGWQDPSFIRDGLTMALYERMGYPAPRVAYARLFINGELEGLYAMVESIDVSFLTRTFGENQGYLFEYEWVEPFHAEYLGYALDPYRARFKAQTNESHGDVTLYTPIHNLFLEANEPDSAAWAASVEQFIDIPQFLTHVAIEKFVAELDGVVGYWGMNNFYVYRPAGSTQHHLIPWDRDNAFQEVDSSVLLRAEENVLLRRVLSDPAMREVYLQKLEACARAMADEGWFVSQVQARAAVIAPGVYADVRKPFTDADFDAWVAYLSEFGRLRSGIVLSEVAAIRQSGDASLAWLSQPVATQWRRVTRTPAPSLAPRPRR